MSIIKKLTELGYPYALIKRFKGLPNVAEFETERLGIHEYAAVYGIKKVIRKIYVEHLNPEFRPNKYLEYQMTRITKLAYEGETERAWQIAEILVRKSVCFRTLAMNRVQPTWFLLSPRKLSVLWIKLGLLCRDLSKDLNYARVWIDKKPGDYARPLGVPAIEWRMFSYMMLDVTERILRAQGSLAKWQHGGRSGVGLMTAWKDLIPRLQARNIYEFDLKGFFDNVTHKAIAQSLRGRMSKTFLDWYEGIVSRKPSKYKLPKPNMDKALLDIRATMTHIRIDKTKGLPPLDYMLGNYTVKSRDLLDAVMAWSTWVLNDQPEGYIYEGFFNPVDGLPLTSKGIQDFKETYIGFLDQKHEGVWLETKEPEDMERELARDEWKGLGKEGRGVPQGLSVSPFISTHVLERELNKDKLLRRALVMYMDDGVLVTRSKEDMHRAIQSLKDRLASIGIEISPEKSGWIKEDGKWTGREFRFLGLVYDPATGMMRSKTRGGTEMSFPIRSDWHMVENLASTNGLEISGVRRVFDRLLNTKSHEAGLKYGFLGCLIADSQYKDNPPEEVKRQLIEAGYARKLMEIISAKSGFIWKFQDAYPVLGDIKTLSSIAVANFMKRRGKIFVRRWRRANPGVNRSNRLGRTPISGRNTVSDSR